jgi:hypothetical protein
MDNLDQATETTQQKDYLIEMQTAGFNGFL